jgi:hypothetical protein
LEVKKCACIDDHTIELYVMGKLDDPAVSAHLDTCLDCKPRINDFREFIEAMKQGIKEWDSV